MNSTQKTEEKAKGYKRLVLFLKKNARTMREKGDQLQAAGQPAGDTYIWHKQARLLDKLIEMADAARSVDDGMWESLMDNVQLEKL